MIMIMMSCLRLCSELSLRCRILFFSFCHLFFLSAVSVLATHTVSARWLDRMLHDAPH